MNCIEEKEPTPPAVLQLNLPPEVRIEGRAVLIPLQELSEEFKSGPVFSEEFFEAARNARLSAAAVEAAYNAVFEAIQEIQTIEWLYNNCR